MNTLIIGDLHAPFIKERYLEHCVKAREDYNCKRVMCTGDILDNHFSSFHTTSPDGHGAKDEFDAAIEILREWYDAFPKMMICLGNHDLIPQRQAYEAGLSQVWVKKIDDVFKEKAVGFKGWKFAEDWLFGDILYLHGLGGKSKPRMYREGRSIVQGHYHSECHLDFHVTPYERHFALQVGCGIDKDAYAMAYGKHFAKPIIGCAVIIDDYTPIPLTMKL